MKLLFCLDTTFSRQNGGIASVSLTLKKGFESHGHSCIMLSATQNRENACKEQFYLPVESTDYKNEKNRQWFRQLVIDKQIDVIINQNGVTPKSVWAIVWAQGLPVKIITVYHGDFESLWSCHKDKLTENLIVKKLQLKYVLDYIWHQLFRVKYRNWLRLHVKKSNKIVFLTDKFFDFYNWLTCEEIDERYAAIHNPVEDRFNIDISNLKKAKEVLFVGRLSKEKGINYLLEVWAKVVASHPEWHLIIVGEGAYKDKIEELQSQGQIPNICLEGYQDPLEYYKRGQIICLTSLTEGFAVVLVEGMSCGCVPIAFNSYACASDIIDDGKCGFLIEPFDTNKYAEKLSSLIDDYEILSPMINSAKVKSMMFSLERTVAQWMSLINSI